MLRRILSMLLAVAVMGCGGNSGPEVKLAPVSGVVTVNGQPVENPIVNFYPESGPSGIGVGNEKGEFTVSTNGSLGAPVGKCKVTVTISSGMDIPPSDGNETKIKRKAKVNAKYATIEKTDLLVDVPEAGNETLKLEVE